LERQQGPGRAAPGPVYDLPLGLSDGCWGWLDPRLEAVFELGVSGDHAGIHIAPRH
jgi:hypothetical protein